MANAIASLAVAINANVGGLQRGMKTARGEVKGFAADLKSLKLGLGEESGLGNFGKILAGGGALAGITIIARQLEKAATEAGKVAIAMQEGDASIGELVDSSIRLVPVFGEVWSAGRAIRRSAEDTEAAILSWAGASQQVVDHFTSVETKMERIQRQAEFADKITESAHKSNRIAQLARLDGIAREQEAIKQRYDAEIAEIGRLQREAGQMRDPQLRRQAEMGLKLRASAAASVQRSETDAAIKREQERRAQFVGGIAERAQQLANEARLSGLTGIDREKQAIEDRYATEMQSIAEVQKELDKLNHTSLDTIKGNASLNAARVAIEEMRTSRLAEVARNQAEQSMGKINSLRGQLQGGDVGAVVKGTLDAFKAERRNADNAKVSQRIQEQSAKLLAIIAANTRPKPAPRTPDDTSSESRL